MRWARPCAAIAAWAPVIILLAACSDEAAVQPVVVAAPPPPAVSPARRPAPRAEEGSPNGVRVAMVKWFAHAGYKEFQVEALVEHARIESGFRPCAKGAGLRYTFQWGGLRLQRLNEFAGTRGTCPPLEKQLAFADSELRNEPNFACFWRATTKSSALAALRRGFGGGSC